MLRSVIPGQSRSAETRHPQRNPARSGPRKRRAPRDDAAFAQSVTSWSCRILDRLESREFDVVELAVDLLDLADVDVLHDVAGFRIDRDRAARAFPLHPLHGRDQRIAVGLAAGLLQRLVDQVDAVIAADRHEARTAVEGLLVGGDELLVHRRRMRCGVQMRGDGAERRVAHAVAADRRPSRRPDRSP